MVTVKAIAYVSHNFHAHQTVPVVPCEGGGIITHTHTHTAQQAILL